jgi:hypothetical protein
MRSPNWRAFSVAGKNVVGSRVDVGSGVVRVYTLQYFRYPTGVVDVFDPTLQLTHGVLPNFAMILADHLAELICMLFQQILEAKT